jgi:hypothetical protein
LGGVGITGTAFRISRLLGKAGPTRQRRSQRCDDGRRRQTTGRSGRPFPGTKAHWHPRHSRVNQNCALQNSWPGQTANRNSPFKWAAPMGRPGGAVTTRFFCNGDAQSSPLPVRADHYIFPGLRHPRLGGSEFPPGVVERGQAIDKLRIGSSEKRVSGRCPRNRASSTTMPISEIGLSHHFERAVRMSASPP